MITWKRVERPGYFGRRRDQKIAEYDARFGKGNWELRWIVPTLYHDLLYTFETACKTLYEESYFHYLKNRKEDLAFICSYGECIDNAMTNIESGLDYTKQEAFSTHIQDIAVRNVLNRLGLKFNGPKDKILVIRSADTEGYRFGPGNIPFVDPKKIEKPSLRPKWAKPGSVEDFWQSNKIIVRKDG